MININCNKGHETLNMGNIYDTNEWINPEAKLSEITLELNFFISWPNYITKTFPAILGIYSTLMCYEMTHATCLLEKARDRNF